MAEISESQKEQIKKQAKKILDDFADAIESVKIKEKKKTKEVGGFREEKQGKKLDESFRKIMFRNAPQKDEDNIIAEKKKW